MQIRQWGKERFMDIEVDVSQPGEFSGQFVPKCPIAVFYALQLELPPSLSDDSETEALLEGLEARLSVMDSHGSELKNLKDRRVELRYRRHGKTIGLERLYRLPEEKYMLRITITQGAKALSETKQRLILKYIIGFQGIAPFISSIASVIALALGAGLFFFGLRLTTKRHAH